MKIDGRSGDHKGENIVIAGQNEPDVNVRTPGAVTDADPADTDPNADTGKAPAFLPAVLGCSGAAIVLIVIAAVLSGKKKKK